MSMRYVAASMLAQIRPSVGTAVVLYTAPADVAVEITRLNICHLTNGNRWFSLFLDGSGTGTFDESNALIWRKDLGAFETDELLMPAVGAGIIVERGARLGVQVESANDFTFTLFGVPEQVAPTF